MYSLEDKEGSLCYYTVGFCAQLCTKKLDSKVILRGLSEACVKSQHDDSVFP